MTDTEKEFFRIITELTTFIETAKACARKYEEGLREAWEVGYNDGCSDGQSYAAGYPQKKVNPYKKEQ